MAPEPAFSHCVHMTRWPELVVLGKSEASPAALEAQVRSSVGAAIQSPSEWYAIGIELTIHLGRVTDASLQQRLGEAYLYATTSAPREATPETSMLFTGLLGPMIGNLVALRPAIINLLGPSLRADRMFLLHALRNNRIHDAELILSDMICYAVQPHLPIQLVRIAVDLACTQELSLRLGALMVRAVRQDCHPEESEYTEALEFLESVLALEFGQAVLDQAVAQS